MIESESHTSIAGIILAFVAALMIIFLVAKQGRTYDTFDMCFEEEKRERICSQVRAAWGAWPE